MDKRMLRERVFIYIEEVYSKEFYDWALYQCAIDPAWFKDKVIGRMVEFNSSEEMKMDKLIELAVNVIYINDYNGV